MNASGDASEHWPEPAPDVLALARRETADDHALRRELVVDLVVHDPAVAHDDQPGAVPGFGRERRRHRARSRRRRADLVLGQRAVPVEVEVVDPAVAPDLLGAVGHATVGEPLRRAPAPVDEPVGTAEREGGCRQ